MVLASDHILKTVEPTFRHGPTSPTIGRIEPINECGVLEGVTCPPANVGNMITYVNEMSTA